jgi:ferredoxin
MPPRVLPASLLLPLLLLSCSLAAFCAVGWLGGDGVWGQVHVQNLKPMPVAHGVVDTCMECGFCESACPSGHVTLTPRQRIVATRELARLDMGTSAEDRAKADEMRTIYNYQVRPPPLPSTPPPYPPGSGLQPRASGLPS